MTTLEMMNEAERTGKTYRADNLLYNNELGFHAKNKNRWAGFPFPFINNLFDLRNWEEDSTIYMTKSEVEEKYGIEIVEDENGL